MKTEDTCFRKCLLLVRPAGFEPVAYRVGVCHSIQLSYGRIFTCRGIALAGKQGSNSSQRRRFRLASQPRSQWPQGFALHLNWTILKCRSLTRYPTALQAHTSTSSSNSLFSIPTFFHFVKLFLKKFFLKRLLKKLTSPWFWSKLNWEWFNK